MFSLGKLGQRFVKENKIYKSMALAMDAMPKKLY